uniref:Amidohydrolase 3 domain-containing protein n=1 Tax=Mucochytrium quahogii TaxID=96639 RepID=A0A7S2W8D0_9STRA|mmetsp:Transcript_23923/g.38162  ORF Transcript_23923/g.38162 Transcript_23923/m.38162 type:complete len:660 (-) Transcript_23923:202-2181(-)
MFIILSVLGLAGLSLCFNFLRNRWHKGVDGRSEDDEGSGDFGRKLLDEIEIVDGQAPEPSLKKASFNCGCHNVAWEYMEESIFNLIKKKKRVLGVDNRKKKLCAVYVGGTIRPMAQGNIEDTVEAMGIEDGLVVATGTLDQVKERMVNGFETIALQPGQTLIPGLIEPHAHIVPSAALRSWHDFSPFDGQYLRKGYTVKWFRERLVEIVNDRNHEDWIFGYGADPSLMGHKKQAHGLNVIERLSTDSFDDIVQVRPLMIVAASGHTLYANSVFLKLLYNKSFKEKYASFKAFRSAVDANGGLQEMEQIVPALKLLPAKSLLRVAENLFRNLDEIYDEYASRGVTMVYDALSSPLIRTILTLHSLVKGKEKVKVGCTKVVSTYEDATRLREFEPVKKYKPFYFGHVKIISDGSNQGLTGYQSACYRCQPANNCGKFNFSNDEFQRIVQHVVQKKKWPTMVHANGDKAVERVIHAFEGSIGEKTHHRIEHCSLLTLNQIARMAKMGVSPSFLIGHVGYWGAVFQDAIFEEKSLHLDLCKSAVARGLRISLHSDNFITPIGPLRLVEQAVTRIMEGDPQKRVLNGTQRLSISEALLAVTYNAAIHCGADKWVGSLEPGKYADFCVLDKDPLTMETHVGLRDLVIHQTVCSGNVSYQEFSTKL